MTDPETAIGLRVAWELSQRGRLDEARDTLEPLAAVLDTPTARSMQERWEEAADVEESLAGVCFLGGRYEDAIGHAQQAVLWSRRFRAGSHFIAAASLSALGQDELARSKLTMIIERSDDYALRFLALAQIGKLEGDTPGIRKS